ncbi:MAG: cation diffusion facilitator family transporter [Actinobacteria bacterium]|nr:cation diffusion facilitator family transporter [Acidimicrobiaceae bacterium]MBP6487790.1 cation diffusion facilitator family transporter [Ilumatobacteraceae bacterium]NMD25644.1 cation diffusion facilitator family transporter [Actinomycetota bacterium]MBP7889822.1 cation diffusion facilitator family transporter [Ilumatobacteraceae bacterium]MBP8211026.1 cation diffusion facilitator family transporter [Ilumatobacteraceae bacterium]
MQDGSRKAIIAAFFANLGIAIAKFVGFLLTRSAGLLAEAGHSLADTGNQGLLMFGGKRGKRPADRAHPFGYGPERYFWSFIVALVLFSMGGLFALYEGIHKLSDPHEIKSIGIAYAILLVSIALETYSLRTAVKEANHVRHGRSWWRFIRTSKAPELPVVLLEDVGAQTGLVVALLGLGMADITGDPRWDAVGSITIGVLLVVIAIILATEMKGLLIGESASDEDLDAINASLAGADKVNGIIHLRTMHLGPDQLLVAAKLDFDPTLNVAELALAIDGAEASLRAAVPIAATIYIEPDILRQPAE